MPHDAIVNAWPDIDTPALRLARVTGELRRGQPVRLIGPDALHAVVAAVETLRPPVWDALRAHAPLVLLTRERAATLKIRLYTKGLVALPAQAMSLAVLRAVADPTADLSSPLKGPFAVLRHDLPPHAAAALHLVRRTGLLPAAVFCPGLEHAGLLEAQAEDLLALDPAGLPLEVVAATKLPCDFGHDGRLIAFRPSDGSPEHLALVIGDPVPDLPVLVRLHSECFTGDLLGSLRCDCGPQLRGALKTIAAAGAGVLLYLRQEGRGIGLTNKLKAYALQDQGFDTVEANLRLGFESDERDFRVAAAMLAALGYGSVRLLTNNPAKIEGLRAAGVTVVEHVPHAFPANPHNAHYLAVKAAKSGHLL